MKPVALQSVRRGNDSGLFNLKRCMNSGEPARCWALVTQIERFIQKVARAGIRQGRIEKQLGAKDSKAITIKRGCRRVLRYCGGKETCCKFIRPQRAGHG